MDNESIEMEFTHDGVEYVAVDPSGHANCDGCAFFDVQCVGLKLPSCWAQTRSGGKYKIFVQK